jgi:hypothetical protein
MIVQPIMTLLLAGRKEGGSEELGSEAGELVSLFCPNPRCRVKWLNNCELDLT